MIYLKVIKIPLTEQSDLNGKEEDYKLRLGFFEENDESKPVNTETALEKGFTFTRETYNMIDRLIEEGHKYEKVQKSAHQEFDDIIDSQK